MTIRLYNTMTRKKEAFEPIAPPRVSIYNCGPTVYDHFHIGNARNFVVMDVVRRYFEYRGYDVCFVQNLTDIDDKIINKANKEGIEAKAVTDKFIPLYFADAEKLRIRSADAHPCATEHIDDIIALIGKLVDKGLAYPAGGSVYYRVRNYAAYGKLSGRKTEDLLEGARVEVSGEKEDPADFALWKAVKPGEPQWESPWGPGRPGWHIECSAMAMKHLGETIDIHAGGTDLTFPHHENEIAQSEGATGKPFARYWMHNGFLNIDSEKMSKSLGNFLKIDQVLERASAAAVRYFLLSAHYRSPLDLTETALDEAASAVTRMNQALETAKKILATENTEIKTKHFANQNEVERAAKDEVQELRGKFEAAMDDDFNTPKAMAVLFAAIGRVHALCKENTGEALARLPFLVDFIAELRDFFSFEPAAAAVSGEGGLAEPLLDLFLEIRQMARKEKAFAIADTIRDRLGELGVAIEDHPQGTIWKYKDR